MILRKIASGLGVGVWAACALGAFVGLMAHESLPGKAANAPVRLAKTPARFASKGNLLLFISPDCECSKATLTELEDFLASEPKKLQATVYISCAADCPTAAAEGKYWQQAESIPEVTVKLDRGCLLARHFGAETSGQVLLYSASSGKLVFSGGITPSRAEVGENSGIDTLRKFLEGKQGPACTPVYGCALDVGEYRR